MLAGEVVLVTGGARGLGAAISELAAGYGAQVAILDVTDAAEVVHSITDSGGHAVSWMVDITDPPALARTLAEVPQRLGDPTVLINNAGRNAYFDPLTMTLQDWNDVFDVDLRSAWLTARAVLTSMIERGRGSIINIGSIHATATGAGYFPYAAAKAGLVGLTKSLALEVAPHGVRVNAVSPGWTRTPLVQEWIDNQTPTSTAFMDVVAKHPLGRIAEPREVAEVVCFLASGRASFVTAAEWLVDGGLLGRF